MPPATRNQLSPVRVFDRRNHFAREGLRRVMSATLLMANW